jgi:hypothetical protein
LKTISPEVKEYIRHQTYRKINYDLNQIAIKLKISGILEEIIIKCKRRSDSRQWGNFKILIGPPKLELLDPSTIVLGSNSSALIEAVFAKSIPVHYIPETLNKNVLNECWHDFSSIMYTATGMNNAESLIKKLVYRPILFDSINYDFLRMYSANVDEFSACRASRFIESGLNE